LKKEKNNKECRMRRKAA